MRTMVRPIDVDIGQLSNAERLARAVLLLHRGGPWTTADREIWKAITGQDEASTKSLCDFARKIRKAEERVAVER